MGVQKFYDNHWIKVRSHSVIESVEREVLNGSNPPAHHRNNTSWRYAYNMRLIKLRRRVVQDSTSELDVDGGQMRYDEGGIQRRWRCKIVN